MTSTTPLPNATDAEQSVLSTLLQSPDEHFPLVIERGLQPESFYLPAHATIFRVIHQRFADGLPIELVSLTQFLRGEDLLDSIGGPSVLTTLLCFSPTHAHLVHHLDLVLNAYRLRQTQALCADTMRAVLETPSDAPTDIDALLTGLSEAALRIQSATDAGLHTSTPAKIVLRDVLDELQDRIEGKTDPHLPSPWPLLRTGRGHLIIVSARPGGGKTAFALNWLEHLAAECAEPVSYLTLEMPSHQLGSRTLTTASGVSFHSLTNSQLKEGDRRLTKGDIQKLAAALDRYSAAPLHYQDLPGGHVGDVIRAIRADHRRLGVNVFAVDYLQLFQPLPGFQSHTDKQRIDGALRDLNALRKQLGITLILLSQLDRKADGTPARQIPMSWQADSSLIEKDADTIIVLGEPGEYDNPPALAGDKELRELATPKQRGFAPGCFPIAWEDSKTKFSAI